MNTIVYWMVGMVYVGPGKVRYDQVGPFLTKVEAEQHASYAQGRLRAVEVVVPDWFSAIMADAEPGDIQVWKWAVEYGYTPKD